MKGRTVKSMEAIGEKSTDTVVVVTMGVIAIVAALIVIDLLV
jgi:hypothetical protein